MQLDSGGNPVAESIEISNNEYFEYGPVTADEDVTVRVYRVGGAGAVSFDLLCQREPCTQCWFLTFVLQILTGWLGLYWCDLDY